MRLGRRRASKERTWEFGKGFPVGDDPFYGESAFVGLSCDGVVWTYVTLEGVDREALGEARVAGARVLATFAADGDEWGETASKLELDHAVAMLTTTRELLLESDRGFVDEATAQLAEAREWLLENERGCLPVEHPEELTRAGAMFTRLSAEDPLWKEHSCDEA